MARDLRPDAVVIDLDLAADGGAAFLTDLRRDPAMRSTPVLGVSSDPEVSRAADVAEVLHRPVSVTGLAQALTRALSGPPAMRAAS